jgi:amino-acid N-acetyltransferase
MKVERARARDLAAARRLLAESDLTTQGLEEAELWCVREAGSAVGVAGLETWGSQGLLRSVVVQKEHRGEGMGKHLVERVSKEARTKGLSELYLITETAPHFFEKLGFESVERKKVKGKVLNSIEFRGACSETAPVMRLRLASVAQAQTTNK